MVATEAHRWLIGFSAIVFCFVAHPSILCPAALLITNRVDLGPQGCSQIRFLTLLRPHFELSSSNVVVELAQSSSQGEADLILDFAPSAYRGGASRCFSRILGDVGQRGPTMPNRKTGKRCGCKRTPLHDDCLSFCAWPLAVAQFDERHSISTPGRSSRASGVVPSTRRVSAFLPTLEAISGWRCKNRNNQFLPTLFGPPEDRLTTAASSRTVLKLGVCP
jgi:hypothetical protein